MYIDDYDDDDDDRGGRRGGGGKGKAGGRGQKAAPGGFQNGNNFANKKAGFFPTRRKVCPIRIEEIDWKKIDSLRYFIGEGGGIRPRRKTGATAKLQRKAAIAIKRARHMALLPFTNEHLRLMRNQRDD